MLIFDKGVKVFQWGKEVFWTNGTGTAGCPYWDEWNFIFTSHHTWHSTWIIDLNVKAQTIKLLKENIKKNLHDLWTGWNSSDVAQEAMTRKKINRLTSSKLKTSAYCEENGKGNHKGGENTAKQITGKELGSRFDRKSYNWMIKGHVIDSKRSKDLNRLLRN